MIIFWSSLNSTSSESTPTPETTTEKFGNEVKTFKPLIVFDLDEITEDPIQPTSVNVGRKDQREFDLVMTNFLETQKYHLGLTAERITQTQHMGIFSAVTKVIANSQNLSNFAASPQSSWSQNLFLGKREGFVDESLLAPIYDKNGNVVGRLRLDFAKDWNRAVIDASKKGVDLRPTSPGDTYRGPEVYNSPEARRKIEAGILAKPGRSWHNWGLAIDVEDTKGAYDWLKKNGNKYGIWWGERRDEPWHWRSIYKKEGVWVK